MSIYSIVSLVFSGGLGFAAVPPLKAAYVSTLEAKKNAYRADGVFTGGIAGTGTSILAIRRAISRKTGLERVIVDLGDRDGRPPGKGMGYFQVGLDAKNNRLTLDVAQLHRSKVSEAQVRRIFRQSNLVRNVSFTLDPQDNAATMVLDLKRPISTEVFRAIKRGKPAQIVMDLQPRTTR